MLAALRNAVTTALCLAGAVSIAAAHRAAALDPDTIIQIFERRSKRDNTVVTEPWAAGDAEEPLVAVAVSHASEIYSIAVMASSSGCVL